MSLLLRRDHRAHQPSYARCAGSPEPKPAGGRVDEAHRTIGRQHRPHHVVQAGGKTHVLLRPAGHFSRYESAAEVKSPLTLFRFSCRGRRCGRASVRHISRDVYRLQDAQER